MTEACPIMLDDGTGFKLDPFCAVFPQMSDDELAVIVADMRIRGYDRDQPITLMPNGLIIDGRNRAIAAERAGVEPTYTTYHGNDPLNFVRSRNLNRRHLTTSQKSMIGAELANMERGGTGANQFTVGANPPIGGSAKNDKISQSEAAETMGVSLRSVQRASKVKAKASDNVVYMVKSGEISLNKASDIVNTVPKDQQKNMTVTEIKRGNTPIEKELWVDPHRSNVEIADICQRNESSVRRARTQLLESNKEFAELCNQPSATNGTKPVCRLHPKVEEWINTYASFEPKLQKKARLAFFAHIHGTF